MRKFVTEFGLPFPVLLDQKGRTRERFGLTTVPTSVFIDAHGLVRAFNGGPIDAEAIESGLAEILTKGH